MWRDFIAVALLLCLLAGAVLNTWYLGKMTNELLGYIVESEKLAADGDIKGAAERAAQAARRWSEAYGYTRVLLRQTEIDSATDAFYGLLKELYAENPGAAQAAYANLREHIGSISEMESVSLGSIF